MVEEDNVQINISDSDQDKRTDDTQPQGLDDKVTNVQKTRPPFHKKFSLELSSEDEDEDSMDNEFAEVLIIDDQQFNLFAMQGQLSQFRVASDTAMSGEKALELLGERLKALVEGDITKPLYKLIVIDYSMPGLSGPETAREMCKMFEQFKEANDGLIWQIPYLVCLTAYSGKEFRDEAIGAGMNEFCLKPIPSNNFKGLLAKTGVI